MSDWEESGSRNLPILSLMTRASRCHCEGSRPKQSVPWWDGHPARHFPAWIWLAFCNDGQDARNCCKMPSGVQIVPRLRLSRISLPSPQPSPRGRGSRAGAVLQFPLPRGEGHRVRGFVLQFRSLKGFCNSFARLTEEAIAPLLAMTIERCGAILVRPTSFPGSREILLRLTTSTTM